MSQAVKETEIKSNKLFPLQCPYTAHPVIISQESQNNTPILPTTGVSYQPNDRIMFYIRRNNKKD